MLEDLGHTATEAPSAAVAIEILGRSFDLVITGHAMPGMTG
jgi:CheY-like chemotaxis protein